MKMLRAVLHLEGLESVERDYRQTNIKRGREITTC